MMYRSFILLILMLLNNIKLYALMPGSSTGPRTGPAYAWTIAVIMPLIILGVLSLYYYCKIHEYRIFKFYLYFKSLKKWEN